MIFQLPTDFDCIDIKSYEIHIFDIAGNDEDFEVTLCGVSTQMGNRK